MYVCNIIYNYVCMYAMLPSHHLFKPPKCSITVPPPQLKGEQFGVVKTHLNHMVLRDQKKGKTHL